jgi:predicted ATPase/class 3 adenylate cyclase
MAGFIPTFIAEKHDAGEEQGSFRASVIFLDISGFTKMTSALMRHGKEGAEVLSGILRDIFGRVVDIIMEEGGWVSTFAGDAATVVFEGKASDNVCRAALRIGQLFDKSHLQRTNLGDFTLDVKMGIDHGEVEWGILRTGSGSVYFVRGEGIDGAAKAEHRASSRDIVITASIPDIPEGCSIIRDEEDSRYRKLRAPSERPSFPKGKPARPGKGLKRRDEIEKEYIPLDLIPDRQVGEFRDITSVFISFREPEEQGGLASLVGEVRSLAREFGGYFNLLDFGDKGGIILLIFGAPISHEDNILRAVTFARALLESRGEEVRLGLASGTAYTGLVGGERRKTYTALGSVVNLSARISMSGEWGTAETESRTRKGVSDRFSMKDAGKRDFKGFAEPVDLYLVAEELSFSRNETTALLGREEEIKRINRWLDERLEGTAGIFYVYGAPGTGKHLLGQAAARKAPDRFRVINLLSDTILRKSMNPFLRVLPAILLPEKALTLSNLEANLDEFMKIVTGSEEERELVEEFKRYVPALYDLLGLPVDDPGWQKLDPQGRFEMQRSALAFLFFILALRSPLLLVVEEAHALDEDSRMVFDRIVSGGRNLPLALLALAREGDVRELPRVTYQVQTEPESLTLGPLGKEAARTLVSRTLGGEPDDELMHYLEERSGLNPLFLTELVRHMRGERLIVERKGGFSMSGEESGVPESLSSIMVSRVDRLPEGVRNLVRLASVIGREFNREILRQLASGEGASESDFETMFQDAEEKDIWSRLQGDIYVFNQPLVQEAAYEMQFQGELKELHGRVAERIKEQFRGDRSYFADQSYHYDRAGRKKETLDALKGAIDYAAYNFKNRKALEFISRYLELSEDDGGQLEMYRTAADIYELTGDWNDAIDSLTYGLGISFIGRMRHEQPPFLARLGTIYQKQGNSQKALDVLHRAVTLAMEENNRPVLADAYTSMGRAFWSVGDYDEAFNALRQAIYFSVKLRDMEREALATYYEGVVFRDTNRYDKAIEKYTRSLEIFRELDNDRLTTYPMYDLAVVYQYQGRLDESQEYFQETAEIYEQIAYLSGLSAALLNLGVLRDRRGRFDEALEYFGRSLEMAHQLQEDLAIAYTLFSIGSTYYKLYDYRKSLAYLKDAYRLMKEINALGYFGYVLSYLASLYARDGKPEFAIRTAYLHAQNMQKTGSDVENGRTWLAMALTLAREPELDEDLARRLEVISRQAGLADPGAEDFFHKAITVSSEANYVNTLIPARHHYAHFLNNQGRKEEALEQVNLALDLAVKSGWEKMEKDIREELPLLL